MAGVYIKGMEMPGSCGECRFLNPGNYKGKEYPCVCDVGDFLVKPSETDLRDGLCPLVEVPDHGDLIDANTMIGIELYDECREEWYEEAMTVWEYLGHASTTNVQIVIPADKEGAKQ